MPRGRKPGFKHDPQTRAKISRSMKGKTKSEEHKRKIGDGLRNPECWGKRLYVGAQGYLFRYLPNHPLADRNGLVPEHRRVWFDAFGPIPMDFVVHHVDHNHLNNHVLNLMLMERLAHMRHHEAHNRVGESADAR